MHHGWPACCTCNVAGSSLSRSSRRPAMFNWIQFEHNLDINFPAKQLMAGSASQRSTDHDVLKTMTMTMVAIRHGVNISNFIAHDTTVKLPSAMTR